jgi:hypothetical protein
VSPINARTHDAILDCRSHVLAALIEAMGERHTSPDWIRNERLAVTIAANRWAQAHGYDRHVTVADVEHLEGNAVGHYDYARKLALYVAEFVVAPDDWQVKR